MNRTSANLLKSHNPEYAPYERISSPYLFACSECGNVTQQRVKYCPECGRYIKRVLTRGYLIDET